jgi:hypothetical protein
MAQSRAFSGLRVADASIMLSDCLVETDVTIAVIGAATAGTMRTRRPVFRNVELQSGHKIC